MTPINRFVFLCVWFVMTAQNTLGAVVVFRDYGGVSEDWLLIVFWVAICASGLMWWSALKELVGSVEVE